MKKTYLKPGTLTVNIAPQQLMSLSRQEGNAVVGNKVYGRQGSFSDWKEEEE